MTQHADRHPARHEVPVAVVGGGQAGLSVSWYLQDAGIEHVVLEAATAAHEWADTRWDNFTLVTPNWHCRLPGYVYDGDDPDGFMTRDEVVAWLGGYAATLAYGLRNVSDPLLALREARRVLKPGSKIAVLDFNHSESAAVDAAQAAALAGAVVPVARALGVGPQYEYLRPSILAYPTGKELVALAREAGFDGEVRFHEIALGLMGCLVAGTKRR